MTRRAVTERDLRAPEFRDLELEDLEWRADGTLARKDRWEQGLREIAGIVGLNPRKGFEVADVVVEVRELRTALSRYQAYVRLLIAECPVGWTLTRHDESRVVFEDGTGRSVAWGQEDGRPLGDRLAELQTALAHVKAAARP